MNPNNRSASGTPPTNFKTNVNRAKTKRWVEAKSYSYDGDDWGDVDDYDEYGTYDEPAPVQKPTGLRQQGQSASSANATNNEIRRDTQDVPHDSNGPIQRGSGQPYPQQQQILGEQGVSSPQQYQQSERARTASWNQQDTGRANSMGYAQSPLHQGGTFGPGPGPGQPGQSPFMRDPQMRRPSQGQQFYQQPVQSRSRPNIETYHSPASQGYPPSPSYRGPLSDRPRLPIDGNRSQSMTSHTAAMEFQGRRDFSPSAMPLPLHMPIRGHPPRKSSLSQDDNPNVIEEPSSRSTDQSSSAAAADSGAKPLPFVRPADIYKRMQEEREKERQSQESSRPSMDAIIGNRGSHRDNSPSNISGGRPSQDNPRAPPRRKPSFESGDDSETGRRKTPALDPVAERRSEYGMEGFIVNPGLSNRQPSGLGDTLTPPKIAPTKQSTGDRPLLPDVTRMSGFGESLLGSLNSSGGGFQESSIDIRKANEESKPTATLPLQSQEEPSLQHQQSLGFRSVVNKAFEDQIPPTPTSTQGSAVARSNSESTNDISPIVSRAPSAATPALKTREVDPRENIPDIAEEPTQSSPRPNSRDTPKTPQQITRKAFPPTGSRAESSESIQTPIAREMQASSPNNSPARVAAVETSQETLQPQEAELAVATPTNVTHNNSGASSTLQSSVHAPDGAYGITNRNVETKPSTLKSDPPSSLITSGLSNNNREPIGLQGAIPTSSLTNSGSSPIASEESPTKGRVRGLAEKFEADASISGSPSPLRGLTSPQSAEGKQLPRPSTDRLESFRPHLPGGWDSFASNSAEQSAVRKIPNFQDQTASSISPIQQEVHLPNTDTSEELAASTEEVRYATGQNAAHAPEQTGPTEEIEITPTTLGHTLPNSEPGKSSMSDHFTAAAAAGTALAGALASAMGMEYNGSKDHQDQAAKEAGNVDFNTARGRSASTKDTDFHPEASKPWLYPADESSASSIVPTPMDKYNLDHRGDENTLESADYFRPVVPLKQRPRDIDTNPDSPSSVRPQVLPSLSTETSPHDYESDRLRKEIVRELSPHAEHFTPTQSSGLKAPPAADTRLSVSSSLRDQGHDSMVLPKEYESYWNGSMSGDDTSRHASRQTVPEDLYGSRGFEQEVPVAEELPPQEPETRHEDVPSVPEPSSGVTQSNSLQVRPIISHRFSWEPEPEAIAAPTQASSSEIAVSPSIGLTEGSNRLSEAPEAALQTTVYDAEAVNQLPQEPVRLDKALPQIMEPPTQAQISSELPNIVTQPGNGNISLPPPPGEQQKIAPFREISAMKSPADRITAYNTAREQFANMDTGLSHWIMATISDQPEHVGLLDNGGSFAGSIGPGPSPSRNKNTGLRVASGQLVQQPYYQQYLNASSHPVPPSPTSGTPFANVESPSGFSPSGGSGTKQMQAKGKDLLHSAGKFGGKANVAAKGLFSKGKNRFRSSGGADKATRNSSAPNPGFSAQGMQPSHSESQSQTTASSSSLNTPIVFKQHSTPDNTIRATPGSYLRSNINPFQNTQRNGNIGHASRVPRDTRDSLDARRNFSQPPPTSAKAVPSVATYSLYPPGPHRRADSKVSAITIEPETEKSALQSTQSASNSNQTPTQADYDKIIHQSPTSLMIGGAPGSTSRDSDVPESHVSAPSPEIEPVTQAENSANLLPDPSDSTTQQNIPKKEEIEILRSSEDSGVTFHTADGGDQGLSLGERLGEDSNTLDVSHAGVSPEASRPFSFIRFGQFPQEQLSLHAPIMDAVPRNTYGDQAMSPILPAQSFPNRQTTITPVHHGIDYDFIPAKDIESGRPRSRDYSRSYQDPNLHQHPAFRQNNVEVDGSNLPSNYYPAQTRRDEAMLPRAQNTEYQLEGVGPPSAQEITDNRRSSRNSAFFKRLSGTPKDFSPQLAPVEKKDNAKSPVKSGRRKRGSLFRSLTSNIRVSQDDIRSPPSRSRTDGAQMADLRSSSSGNHGRPSYQDDDRGRKSMQLPSTPASPEPKSGKKKRFSGLGNLFVRSNTRQQQMTVTSPQLAFTQAPSQQQSPFNQRSVQDPYAQNALPPHQTSPFNQRPMHDPNLRENLAAGYAQPPLEGYYSPDRKSGTFSPNFINGQRSPSNPNRLSQNRTPITPQATPYQETVRQLQEQPQSAWVRSIIPQAPASSSPQGYFIPNHNTTIRASSQQPMVDSPSPSAKKLQKQSQSSHSLPASQIPRDDSPPPAPPPKDDYLKQPQHYQVPYHQPSSSYSPPAPRTSLQSSGQSPHHQATHSSRQILTPLQTNLPPASASHPRETPKSMTPDEVRKVRQREIEKASLSPIATEKSPQQLQQRQRQQEKEEKIVMSSSSYPGQEWQPYGHWDGE